MIGKKVIDKVILNNKTLKSSVRWDLDSHFPPVGNQGQQGSCAAWAVSYYMNGFLQRKINDWTDDYSWHLMSPAWTYNKVNDGVDDGSYPSDNAYIIEVVGDATLYTMPYDSSDYISWGDESAWREAPLYKIKDYQPIDISDVNTIKYYLNQGYLIYFGINASTPGFRGGNFDGDYILSDYEYGGGIPNHAQTIVGYDDSISDDGEQGAFRVVNSWGTGWGDNGFYWITYKCMSDKIAEYSGGIYLIPMDEQPYTPKLLATWRFSDPGARDGGIDIFCDDDFLQDRFVRFDGGSYPYPNFMTLDISSLYNEWAKSDYKEKFKFLINDGSTSNIISSFKIEYYPYGYYPWYDPEGWAEISTESPDVPITLSTPDDIYIYINSGDFRPEIKIWIGEIKGLDPFDIWSDPDWYYYMVCQKMVEILGIIECQIIPLPTM